MKKLDHLALAPKISDCLPPSMRIKFKSAHQARTPWALIPFPATGSLWSGSFLPAPPTHPTCLGASELALLFYLECLSY